MELIEHYETLKFQLEEVNTFLINSELLYEDKSMAELQRIYLIDSLKEIDSVYIALKLNDEFVSLYNQEIDDFALARTLVETNAEIQSVKRYIEKEKITPRNKIPKICISNEIDKVDLLIQDCENLNIHEKADDESTNYILSTIVYNNESNQWENISNFSDYAEGEDDSGSINKNKSMHYGNILKDNIVVKNKKQTLKVDIQNSNSIPQKCIACNDEVTNDVCISNVCNHYYCKTCFKEFLKYCIKDKSLIPIKCCGVEIDQKLVEKYLSIQEYKKYQNFYIENTSFNKMCCSECHDWIDLNKLRYISKYGTFHCPNLECKSLLCANCKTSYHDNLTCFQYQENEKNKKMSSIENVFQSFVINKNYSQCNKCQAFVELESGCYHITCVCTYQFCYLCKAKWRTCNCPLWDDHRLELRARENLGLNPNQLEIQREARNIRNHEACVTHSWTKINSGNLHCGNCGFYMYVYKYRCRACRFNVCHTCAHHRLG